MKFYPSDWRSDPKLRLVSMAARGLWMEMICLMHEAEPYGELRVAGVPLKPAQLARQVGEPVEMVTAWLQELLEADVYSVRKNGVIFSRRMEKDENRRRKLRENGKKGGNPALRKQTENPPLDNQADKTQKPEARDQSKSSVESAREAVPADAIRDACLKAAGLTEADLGPGTISPISIRNLVNAPENPADLDLDVIPAIQQCAATLAKRGQKITNWSYCHDAIIRNRDARLSGAPEVEHRPGARSSQRPASTASARRHAERDQAFDEVADEFEALMGGQYREEDDGPQHFESRGGGRVIDLDQSQFTRLAASDR
ncbi:hypothetical protein D1227_06300 [Henriciella mobilis]|nr:hypothetical protein D1231_09300 [Henriciella mobilis]RIJ21187.1 hypothetical protein D1227_12840 [Henriciella mobilis]RIJ23112.1 hypothetical protein D1227_06300 [Henriciella mobilis]